MGKDNTGKDNGDQDNVKGSGRINDMNDKDNECKNGEDKGNDDNTL